jgi:hypothetical protein
MIRGLRFGCNDKKIRVRGLVCRFKGLWFRVHG